MGISRRDSITLAVAALAASSDLALAKDTEKKRRLSADQEVDRLLAAHEIQNQMSKYEYFHVADMSEDNQDGKHSCAADRL